MEVRWAIVQADPSRGILSEGGAIRYVQGIFSMLSHELAAAGRYLGWNARSYVSNP